MSYQLPEPTKVEILSSPEERAQTRILSNIQIGIVIADIILFLLLALTVVAVAG